MFDTKKLALFLGGVVFGSAGFKVLSSKDAKKVYTQTTAAVGRLFFTQRGKKSNEMYDLT